MVAPQAQRRRRGGGPATPPVRVPPATRSAASRRRAPRSRAASPRGGSAPPARRPAPRLPPARPWVISQRGLSGMCRRRKMMPMASTAPMPKAAAPAHVGRQQAGLQQDHRADRAGAGADPEAAVDDEVGAAAMASRDPFLDRRVDRRVLAADAGAGDEAAEGEQGEVVGECGRAGGERVHRQRDPEQALAAPAVGEPAEAERAEHRADQVGSSRKARPALRSSAATGFRAARRPPSRPASPRARRAPR